MASTAGSRVGTKRLALSENDAKLLLATSTKTSATEVDLHPVVLLHIADHHHRNVAQHGGGAQVFGALLGRQDGPKAEICFAFEILVKHDGVRYVLDKEYWFEKELQFKQILPGLDYVGWYTVSDDYLSMADLDLQNQFWEVSQNPFLIKAHANKPESFPVDLFESVIEFESGAPSVKFIPLTYNIVFEQAEQIGVHHIATKADAETSESMVAETDQHLIAMQSMSSAVRMLRERLTTISTYLRDVEAGLLPPDESIFVELKRIVEMLESLNCDEQTDKLNILKLQAVMTSSVGNYAQTVEGLMDFIRKNVILVDRRGHQKGMSRMMSGGVGRGPLRSQKQVKPSTTTTRPKTSRQFFGFGRTYDTDEPQSTSSQVDMSL